MLTAGHEHWMQAYIPNVVYGEGHQPDEGSLSQRVVPGLALVATRQVTNEELLLNYRLPPNAYRQRPAWYSPVDAEEDQRRWA